jgi:hypothetical protein
MNSTLAESKTPTPPTIVSSRSLRRFARRRKIGFVWRRSTDDRGSGNALNSHQTPLVPRPRPPHLEYPPGRLAVCERSGQEPGQSGEGYGCARAMVKRQRRAIVDRVPARRSKPHQSPTAFASSVATFAWFATANRWSRTSVAPSSAEIRAHGYLARLVLRQRRSRDGWRDQVWLTAGEALYRGLSVHTRLGEWHMP